MKKSQKRGYQSEKVQARKRRGKHLGGPGKPDYQRGPTKGEVKNWQNPVHSGVIKEAAKKGVKEIVSPSGFTQPAIEEAKKAGITSIIQPGGSIRDEHVMNACNEAGISMVFTGVRHFKH